MTEYIAKYKTFGGSSERAEGTMLVEAENIKEAEDKARIQIIEDGGFCAITEFNISER